MCKSNYWIWHRVERAVQKNPDIPILVSDLFPKTILLQRIPAIQTDHTMCKEQGVTWYTSFFASLSI